MVNKYTIVINNRSGIYQNYTLFTEKPEVTGISNSSIWTNVYQASDVIFDSADAQFEMLENYHAIVGKWKGGPKEGARVGIGQTKKVNLGSLSDDGSLNPGTTLNMVSVDGGWAPSFDRSQPPQSAFINAFEIDTGNDFTVETAIQNNFFVGVAGSPNDSSSSPIATFRPEPGNRYQIKPSNVFYISFGQRLQVGQLVDVAKIRNPLRIDFANSGPNIIINHTPTGELIIAK
ncbi:hypothetical protein J7337_001861 [Fusarium musae]|uniref:Uncharacterized protein n=1 Tax=Fusarium musae TaxID=1042133 RepID=A0A9P8IWS7_9HYPO|nr:hypothetical protein J7337_001861 [Fusarium musae]KAG9508297.1 hypothetical protein J7337_001861 [Fusarium musae]